MAKGMTTAGERSKQTGAIMATTAAQRQAKYRREAVARNKEEGGDVRLSLWLALSAKTALIRLAQAQGISQRAMLERLIYAADEAAIEKIETNSEAWNQYFHVGRERKRGR